MDSIKNREMVYIGDDKEAEDNTVICPYCGSELHFSRGRNSNPRAVSTCEHFTSIFMEAKFGKELRYEQYARFRDM